MSHREVVIGRNSKVWQAACADPAVTARFPVAIGHREVGSFAFVSTDRVWIFSYSRVHEENENMLAVLAAARVSEIVYVSTATANVVSRTRCYEYPRVKKAAEDAALKLGARILTLGIVVDRLEQLPSGRNAATVQQELNEFLLDPQWPDGGGTRKHLFRLIATPFRHGWERALFGLYGALQWSLGSWPCLLRPIDLVLRALGIRWYGYVNLSNRLWISTTS